MQANRQHGFTLVELAIVLVVIGLITGMAFKGRDLIDGAKIKNAQAQYNKVATAFNVYHEKYGSFPGDGWSAAPGTAVTGSTGTRNGLLDSAIETAAALTVLQNGNILTLADTQSALGQAWTISDSSAAAVAHFDTNTNYLTAGGIGSNAVDARYTCQLDRIMDDGAPDSGIVRSSANRGTTAAGDYDNSVDCWNRSGLVSLGIRILP
ncbi:MAG: hypothetical protein H6R07_144 [Proteobacteria bacterium]|nr:hypothetical protein [Pseudomonadota bacterium]